LEPIDYQEMVNRMFLEDPRNEDRSGDMKLHPSAISGCARQAIYAARGEEATNPKDVRYRRIMGNGTDYHDKLQGFMRQLWPGLETEVSFEFGPIKGSVDALMPTDGGLEVQEFKSISPNGMRMIQGTQPRRLKNGTFKPGREAAAKPEHVHQARIYHYCLSQLGYNMSDVIRIVYFNRYFNRDDWTVAEFEVEPWTTEEGQAQELVWAELEGHLMDGTLPDQMPDDYWLCKLCEYRTTCKGMK
jgi:hypothetical protein